jgi:hypothetical protein
MSPCVPPPTKATSAASTAANRPSTRRRPKNNLQIAIETLRIKAYSSIAGLGLTSEMGQSLPKWDVRATSAFPLIATEGRTSRDVSNVPRCDIGERCKTDAPMNNCGKSATSALRCIGRLPIQQNIVHPDFHRDFHVRVRQNIEAPVLHRVDRDPCDVGGG